MIFELIAIFVLLFIIVGLVYQFMFDIWFWVFIVSLIFYLLYVAVKIIFYYKKRKKMIKEKIMATSEPIPEPLEIPKKESMMPKIDKDLQRLVDFIEKNKREGFKPKIIRAALMKQGWAEAKIDEAFKIAM